MHELAGDQAGKIRAPFCTAVLAGVRPGRILVDDTDHPRTALVTRDDGWCFLAGDPGNDALNRAIDRGWSDPEGTRACREFEPLRGLPQGQPALERMEQTG